MNSIIFDLDGTLLDSMPMWSSIDRRFLTELGIDPPADITERIKAMTVPQAGEYFIRRFSLDLTPEQVTERVGALAARAYREELPLKPGAEAFLREARRRGIPCALASITYPELLDAALKRLGIAQYFQAIVTPADGFSGKQDPAIYLHTARLLHTAPQETLVCEDAVYAAKTARDAGFPVLGILDPEAEAEWDRMREICGITAKSWTELLTGQIFQIFSE
ncbi:MAG: HAD family phosphatase [Oscillospiraceae bacterium]|nr:HAD family phosphatase [Oscillospiraceae bacterium]